jgi:hypothetical protein
MIDAVVEEVGEDNVIQVVTDNAANCKASGEMLMRKRKNCIGYIVSCTVLI